MDTSSGSLAPEVQSSRSFFRQWRVSAWLLIDLTKKTEDQPYYISARTTHISINNV